MLPEFLFSTYKQYKTDTNKITTWLVETAKGCGYKSPSLDPDASGENAPDHNAKASKAQGPSTKACRAMLPLPRRKRPRTASADEKANGAEKKLTVPVREFEVMAEHIAKSQDASLKIPRGFINLDKRCIKTRRGVGLVSGNCPGQLLLRRWIVRIGICISRMYSRGLCRPCYRWMS
jgi:hypothetical protein